jgi:hypothetical protein
VFGTIGQDPGTAWSGGGVSTTNQNLSRRRGAIASSAGWVNPGLVFETAGATLAAALAGFGVAPVLDDPYAEWAAARGLADAAAAVDADPDGNGLANGLEFAFGDAAAVSLDVLTPESGHWQLRLGLHVRHRLGPLRWGVAVSDDLAGWRTVVEELAPPAPAAGVFRPLTVSLPVSAAPGGQARLFVVRP